MDILHVVHYIVVRNISAIERCVASWLSNVQVVVTIISGEKGTAFTLVTAKDKEFAGHLVRNLEGANQQVPDDLLDIAMQVSD